MARYISNADIDDEDMADITDWTDEDEGDGVSSQVTFDSQSCMKLDSGSGVGNYAYRTQDIGTFENRTVFSIRLYCDAIGTYGDNNHFWWQASDDATYLDVNFCSDGLFVYDGATYNEVGTDLVVQDTWQEWTFDVDWVAQTVDVYLDKVLKASDVACAAAGEGEATNGWIVLSQFGENTANRISYIDWFKAGSDFNKPIGPFPTFFRK